MLIFPDVCTHGCDSINSFSVAEVFYPFLW